MRMECSLASRSTYTTRDQPREPDTERFRDFQHEFEPPSTLRGDGRLPTVAQPPRVASHTAGRRGQKLVHAWPSPCRDAAGRPWPGLHST